MHDDPESASLAATKKKLFEPLIKWFQNEFQVELVVRIAYYSYVFVVVFLFLFLFLLLFFFFFSSAILFA